MAGVKTKFIFVTGGVVSSLGKGLASASIGALMESRGLKVTLLKMDPYINVDPGTMSPFQHGEVYVTDDGAETDLDLYDRPNLRDRHRQGAAGGLPRRDGAGHPAYHRRDQTADSSGGRRLRYRDWGSRRNGW